jgi:HAD superfamily hydrolase (TIGR01450 family)
MNRHVPPSRASATELIERYDALLLDAFGVLVDGGGPLPGAIEFIQKLNRRNRPYFILTNSASQLPETKAAAFRAKGLPIADDRIISSGMLLAPYFRDHGLAGSRTVVLGPDDAVAFVEQAGGEPLAPDSAEDAEVVVIADQKGFPLLEGLDNTLGIILRRLDRGEPIHLLLCNPDIVYPKGEAGYGFTAGGLAKMFDGILAERYPERQVGFIPLGKPHRPIFEEAARQAGTNNLLMVGDQIATDIVGANRFGIDSALVQTGLYRGQLEHDGATPTYILPSL